ncbi:glycosyltransferase [Sphaerisporangium sp. TRM90804]|uniref:glycosyltransferase n=1 Tax=Sphaerisporangium sp. TRM90804 TaxID=3031113 RepID=UPI00244B37DB|nr:glycosyltransferase [Sphaerisporangium sp. TRM90804]MDH2429647.1 glycosyltransferase [Sphaerisporangium sp. TRM90804]
MKPSTILTAAQAVAALAVLTRLARGRGRRAPLRAPADPGPGTAPAMTTAREERHRAEPALTAEPLPAGGGPEPALDVSARTGQGIEPWTTGPAAPVGAAWGGARSRTISVVIPARDEEHRIGPCVAAALADPSVGEVLVVDDESADGTARVAAELGARVVAGRPLPAGWVGKQWALHQGLAEARGDVVVTLDADTRPRPGLFGAMAAELDGCDLLSAGPRFATGGPVEQALHASFLATLVYRFGPIGSPVPPPPHRVVANGQCMAFRRGAMRAADGFARVRGHLTDDVALARALAGRGWAVRFVDAGDLLEVDMHDSTAEVWREWGRTLHLRDVTGRLWQAGDLAVLWLAAALPVLRLAAGRPTRLDLGLLGTRFLLTAALRASYTRPGPGLPLSPLLDPLTALRLTYATLRPARTWRGRTYETLDTTAARLAPPRAGLDGGCPPVTARPARDGDRPAPPARNAAR